MFLLLTKGYSSVLHDTSLSKSKIRPLYILVKDFEKFNPLINTYDTSLNYFQFINPLRKNNLSFQNLGLPGTPQKNLYFEKLKTPGFDLGFNSMNSWLFDTRSNDEKIVYSPTPYTNLNYTQGEKELIFIEASHTQNLKSRINAGIDYRRIKANNYLFYNFDNQTYDRVRIPNIYNLKFYTSYRSKNDKIYMFGNLFFNKSTLRESGGLKNTSAFDSTSGKLRAFENYLSNATNITKQYAASIKSFYRFGKFKYQIIEKDTSKRDTTGFEFTPKFYFFHDIYLSQTTYNYNDPNNDTQYYEKTFFGKGNSDSMALKEMSNSFGFAFKTKKITSQSKAELSNYGVFNKIYGQESFYNFSIKSNIEHNSSFYNQNLTSGIDAVYFISGYNKNDYLLKAFLLLKKNAEYSVSAIAFSQKHSPAYIQNRFFSNHQIWDQKLSKTERNGLILKFNFYKIKTKFALSICDLKNNPMYSLNSPPKPYDFKYISFDVQNKTSIRNFHFDNRVIYQKLDKIKNFPEFTINGQLYFENKLFRKNMLARIGIDYSWVSEFKADFYVPYTRQFVLQNDVSIGNYPYFNVFLSASIQTVNIYIRYEHINEGMSGANYYSTYLYPNVPRFFSLGINWRLFY